MSHAGISTPRDPYTKGVCKSSINMQWGISTWRLGGEALTPPLQTPTTVLCPCGSAAASFTSLWLAISGSLNLPSAEAFVRGPFKLSLNQLKSIQSASKGHLVFLTRLSKLNINISHLLRRNIFCINWKTASTNLNSSIKSFQLPSK